MVEYGNGVSTGTGAAGGGGGGGGGGGPEFALGRVLGDAVDTIAGLPPEVLVASIIAIFFGLVFLKKAF